MSVHFPTVCLSTLALARYQPDNEPSLLSTRIKYESDLLLSYYWRSTGERIVQEQRIYSSNY